MTRAVILTLGDDTVSAVVIAVDEECKELSNELVSSREELAMYGQLTNVMKKRMVSIMPSAKQALSIAHVLLTCSPNVEPDTPKTPSES